jgi:acetyl/propionyl-CoA carboxylase alpha subunit
MVVRLDIGGRGRRSDTFERRAPPSTCRLIKPSAAAAARMQIVREVRSSRLRSSRARSEAIRFFADGRSTPNATDRPRHYRSAGARRAHGRCIHLERECSIQRFQKLPKRRPRPIPRPRREGALPRGSDGLSAAGYRGAARSSSSWRPTARIPRDEHALQVEHPVTGS